MDLSLLAVLNAERVARRAAILVTTLFTEAFRLTLIVGLPFLVLLALAYAARARSARA